MDKVIFPILGFFILLLCTGHVNSVKFPVSGTSYFNITGTIRTHVNKIAHILDRESEEYQSIATNFTRGFDKSFLEKYDKLNYNVTMKQLFIWPKFPEEAGYVRNLSFAIIAKHEFQTTPKDKGFAETCLPIILRNHRMALGLDEEGFVTSEGMRVKYEEPKIIPEKMVDNITNGYMSFITRLKNSHKDGDENVVTKSPPGNSSEQGSFNTSTRPSVPREPREISLYIIAYIGITMSMIGLFITMTSICYFRRLRKFRRNQILVHICATIMAGMLLSIMSFTNKGDESYYCTMLALLLHYFILAAVSWMCVEAYNLYRDLVKVFNTNVVSCKSFTLRACIFGYSFPAVVVGITCVVDINVYGQRNDACWMTSLAFLVSFLAPVLFIVFVNIVFFSLIMREIIQVSQRDANNIRPSLRAAISLSVVFGFCWLLAGISTFTTNPFVTCAFVIMTSFQGVFIFIFHGIGKQELRDSWKTLPIFKWQFIKFMNTESQERGKSESTTQDTPQVPKRHSTDKTKDSDSNPGGDAGYNQAFSQENSLNDSSHNIPSVPEHRPLKKIQNDC